MAKVKKTHASRTGHATTVTDEPQESDTAQPAIAAKPLNRAQRARKKYELENIDKRREAARERMRKKRAALKEAPVEKQEEARERQRGYEEKYKKANRDLLRCKQDIRRTFKYLRTYGYMAYHASRMQRRGHVYRPQDYRRNKDGSFIHLPKFKLGQAGLHRHGLSIAGLAKVDYPVLIHANQPLLPQPRLMKANQPLKPKPFKHLRRK